MTLLSPLTSALDTQHWTAPLALQTLLFPQKQDVATSHPLNDFAASLLLCSQILRPGPEQGHLIG